MIIFVPSLWCLCLIQVVLALAVSNDNVNLMCRWMIDFFSPFFSKSTQLSVTGGANIITEPFEVLLQQVVDALLDLLVVVELEVITSYVGAVTIFSSFIILVAFILKAAMKMTTKAYNILRNATGTRENDRSTGRKKKRELARKKAKEFGERDLARLKLDTKLKKLSIAINFTIALQLFCCVLFYYYLKIHNDSSGQAEDEQK